MKRISLLLIMLAILNSPVISQVYQPEHWDGYLSIKVKNDSNVTINEFSGEGVHAQFDSLISAFGIYRIERMYRDTSNVTLRKCYTILFSDSARMDTLIARLHNYHYLEYVSKSGIGVYFGFYHEPCGLRFNFPLKKRIADLKFSYVLYPLAVSLSS